MRPRTKQRISITVRVVVSGGLLCWLFLQVDWHRIHQAFRELDPKIWLLALGLYAIAQVLSTFRWFLLAKALNLPGRYFDYFVFYFIGSFFNLFLPTSVGGDVSRIYFLSRNNGKGLPAFYTVIGDRTIGLVAMLAIGAAALAWCPAFFPKRVAMPLIGAAVLGGVTFLGMPLIFRLTSRVWPTLSNRYLGFLAFWRQPRILAGVLGLSFALQIIGMSAFTLLGQSLGIAIPIPAYFAVVPMVAVFTLLPISFNGLGIREGVLAYLLGLKGVSVELSVTFGLVIFSVQAACSVLGGLFYATGLHRRCLATNNEPSRDPINAESRRINDGISSRQ